MAGAPQGSGHFFASSDYAKDDHIIPPATSRALGDKIGSSDYQELGLPGGHVGVFVGGRSQKLFAPAVAEFLAQHNAA